jgi:hypothetical protein
MIPGQRSLGQRSLGWVACSAIHPASAHYQETGHPLAARLQ